MGHRPDLPWIDARAAVIDAGLAILAARLTS